MKNKTKGAAQGNPPKKGDATEIAKKGMTKSEQAAKRNAEAAAAELARIKAADAANRADERSGMGKQYPADTEKKGGPRLKKGAAVKDGSATAYDSEAAAGQLKSLGEDGDVKGPSRMGYTQNFGPARQGGYAKGAARVNSIMKGAPQSDRPKYTEQKTTQEVIPGTTGSVSTSSSGGSTSSTTNIDNLMKGKTDLGPDFKPTQEQTDKANEEVRIAKAKDVAANTGSSEVVTESTAPSIETVVKKNEKVSAHQGSEELLSEGQEIEQNRRGRYTAGREERINIAKKDSGNVAQEYLKGRPVTEANLIQAVQRGNLAGRQTLQQYDNLGSFNEQGGEFKFTKDEASELFSRTIGHGTAVVTDDSRSKANVGDEITVGRTSRGGKHTTSDIGKTVNIGKKNKGKATVTGVSMDTGTAGSFGGYSTPQEYLSGGTSSMNEAGEYVGGGRKKGGSRLKGAARINSIMGGARIFKK